MTIQILPQARDDLIEGYRFYESQGPGLGSYFRDSLLADVDLLATNAGVHAKVFGHHRSLSRLFPFAIYYRVEANVVLFARSSTVAEILLGSGTESAIDPKIRPLIANLRSPQHGVRGRRWVDCIGCMVMRPRDREITSQSAIRDAYS